MNKTYKYYLLTSFLILVFAFLAGFFRLFFYEKEYKILSKEKTVIQQKKTQKVNDGNDTKL